MGTLYFATGTSTYVFRTPPLAFPFASRAIANGNARGGVRNTYVDVPVAKYSVPNSADPKPGTRDDFYCGIAGIETPLPADRLHALYKDAAAYRNKVQQRLDELTKAGWFLPEYAAQVMGDAEKVRIP